MPEKVELIPAHTWDCPECGRSYFARSIVVDPATLTDEEREDVILRLGIEPHHEGELLTAPTKVFCHWCHREFETINYGE